MTDGEKTVLEATPGSLFMQRALQEARAAALRGEVPVGAVVVLDGEFIAAAGNRTRELSDVSAHAELLAIRQAGARLGSDRLPGADLYVTLEPCTLCAAAISFARIRRLYYGAEDEKGGAVDNGVRFFSAPTCHHAPDVYSGLAATEASEILKAFFRERREGSSEP
ncbi:tRNA(Arg) A34 adenosine deaminase TadA [Rhizobium sp. RU20A]|uniref:nucleoside deaminase n=1 Tax=Rhizobium sp. RU20A TaxID=1907412 RepID=UPI000954157A|nr:nucleoside deaminase [Rhizobium sp. RU20A]SIR07254.1 tRNA(Arg) A34 adenosine deaminase TadA [Rhizobium sp. RU20A]